MATVDYSSHGHQETIFRINDGVVAIYLDTFQIVVDHWFASFSIEIPRRIDEDALIKKAMGDSRGSRVPAPRHPFDSIHVMTRQDEALFMNTDPNCTANISMHNNVSILSDCPPYNYLNRIVSMLKLKNLKILDNIYRNKHHQIRDVRKMDSKKRYKRKSGWARFLNHMNIATAEDLETVHDNLLLLQKATQQGFDAFRTAVNDFHSFQHATNLHAKIVNEALDRQNSLLTSLQRHSAAAVNFLLQLSLHEIEYIDIAHQLHELEDAFNMLMQGHLSPQLVTPDMLTSLIFEIEAYLAENNIPLFLNIHDSDQIYASPEFTLAHDHRNVFVMLRLPLSLTARPMHLYRIEALKLPADSQDRHTSRPINLPRYLGWDPESEFYFEMDEYPVIRNNLFYLHSSPAVLKHKDNPSCLVALLELTREDIQRLCTFVIEPDSASAQVLSVAPGKLILQYIPSYTLECAGAPIQEYTGCTLCLLTIRCNCLFTAGVHQYYAQLSRCRNDSSAEPIVFHGTNVHLINFYLNSSELLPDHRTLLSQVADVLLPNLTLRDESYERQAGILKQSLLDMEFVLQSTINQSTVFTDLSEKIAYQMEQTKLEFVKGFSIKDVELIISFLSPILSALALILGVYLFCKFRVIEAALALNAPRARADDLTTKRTWLPNFMRTPKPVLHQPTLFPNFVLPSLKPIQVEDISFQAGIMAILSIICIVLLLKCLWPMFRCCFRLFKRTTDNVPNRVEFAIIFSAGSTTDHISIPILTLPHSVQNYSYEATQFLSRIEVIGRLMPSLHIDWQNLKILHKYSRLTYRLPRRVRITYLQASTLRKIFSENHYVLFHTLTATGEQNILPIREDIWPYNRSEATRETTFARHVTAILDRPPLYPDLPVAV